MVKQSVDRDAPITVPFTVVIDGREKAPYRFTGIQADASCGGRPLVVPTQWRHIKTGDYSIAGMESKICVERKSLVDLYSTLGQHRERFEREHKRMAAMDRAIVVVEASLGESILLPPERSKLNPKTVMRTSIAWLIRYGVPWIWAEDRRLAEIYTFRFLEKAWKELRHD